MNPDTIHGPARARHLRRAAGSLHPLVAQAYRRRASELELESWVRTITTIDRSLIA